MTRTTITCTALALLLAAGCQSYERRPIRLDELEAAWRQRDPGDDATVRQYAAKLARQDDPTTRFDPADGLTLAEAEAVALVFNADLRVRRAEAAVPLIDAAHAGRWDDPTLHFDLLRIIESVDDPWIAGVGVSLTIPLSGRLQADRDQAWAQYGVAWRRVAQQEHETLVELRQAWRRWSASIERAALIQAYLEQVSPIRDVAGRLAAAGEIRPSDARVLALEQATQQIAARRSRDEAERLRIVVMSVMGLRPHAPVTLVAEVTAESNITIESQAATADDPTREGTQPPAPGPRLPGGGCEEQRLSEHPALLVALAEYESAERVLRREVLKQIPDVTLGPVYENDDGQSRIGFSGLIPLPLWNRNVRGIAQAQAQREAARVRVEQAYESLTRRLAEAQAEHDAAARRRAALLEQVAPLVDEQLAELRELINAGEVDVLLLNDALHRSLATKLDVLDAALESSLAMETVRGLLRPRWVAQAQMRPESAGPMQGDER